MINTHTLHYWLDYEPIDIDTLDKMIKTSSPFTPTVTYETEHPTNKMILVKKNIRLDEVPICLDKKEDFVYVLVDSMIYKTQLVRMEPVNTMRYGEVILTHKKIGEGMYLISYCNIILDFNTGKVKHIV